jgi:Spy/CpxP family protein refolding chaperone
MLPKTHTANKKTSAMRFMAFLLGFLPTALGTNRGDESFSGVLSASFDTFFRRFSSNNRVSIRVGVFSMDKVRIGLLSILTAGLLVSTVATAGRAEADHKAFMPRGGPGKFCGKGTMGLDLTEGQKEKMNNLRQGFKKEIEPLRKKTTEDMKAVADKVKSGAKDSQLKPLLDRLMGDRRALQAKRAENLDALRGILTPTQQAQWVARQWRRQERMRKFREDSIRDGDESGPGRGQGRFQRESANPSRSVGEFSLVDQGNDNFKPSDQPDNL